MKASSQVRSGAAPSNALGPSTYGLTFPERVDVDITAHLDKATGNWSPKVNKVTGHYSLQARLLPGQQEVTGPGGNTSQANFCDQVKELKALGFGAGVATWYMLNAVVKHEKVHASRFEPALKAAKPGIVSSIESITLPNAPGMTKAQAITQFRADPNFQAALVNAQQLWLAEILTRVAGDHAAGGPTDQAEHKVVDPMIKKICNHAKSKKWPNCPACP